MQHMAEVSVLQLGHSLAGAVGAVAQAGAVAGGVGDDAEGGGREGGAVEVEAVHAQLVAQGCAYGRGGRGRGGTVGEAVAYSILCWATVHV